jgi:putative hydrolase of the HAD superfamily
VIRGVLIDLDGVVRHWEPWTPDEGVDVTVDDIRSVAFGSALDGVVTGAITDEEWREQVATALEERFGPSGRRAAESWSAPIGSVKQDTLELVREMRAVVPVALITNATSRLESDLAELSLTDEFDLIVNSSRVGAAKPDERIFAYAAEKLGVVLEECLFIDDTVGHVEAAAALGLRTIHFTDASALRKALAAFGLVSGARGEGYLELVIRTARLDEVAEHAAGPTVANASGPYTSSNPRERSRRSCAGANPGIASSTSLGRSSRRRRRRSKLSTCPVST